MRVRVFYLVGLVALSWFGQVYSAELSQTVGFLQEDLTFSQSAGFEVVYLRGCDITSQVGEPLLPVKQVSVILPPGSRVEEVVITGTEGELLPGEYQILPVQPPRILSMMQEPIPFVQPQPRIYQRSAEYPGIPICMMRAFRGGPRRHRAKFRRVLLHSAIRSCHSGISYLGKGWADGATKGRERFSSLFGLLWWRGRV